MTLCDLCVKLIIGVRYMPLLALPRFFNNLLALYVNGLATWWRIEDVICVADNAVLPGVAHLYLGDKAQHDDIATEWTLRFAKWILWYRVAQYTFSKLVAAYTIIKEGKIVCSWLKYNVT